MAHLETNATKLWDILCKLRGKMTTTEYKNYILPFMFYDFASFQIEDLMKKELANDIIMTADGERPIKYIEAWNETDRNGVYTYRKDLIDLQMEQFGFVIEPKYMCAEILTKACMDNSPEYFVPIFEEAIESFETRCSDNFKGTLNIIDLYNEALGESEAVADQLLADLFRWTAQLCWSNYSTNKDSNKDILGDMYEELMGYFADASGTKGGEFYTPAEVSELVAKLATFEVSNANAISDPTCGSGSLLIKVAEQLQASGGINGDLYGQELNSLTHRLAKMNMCLHNVNADNFHIDCCDTLSNNDNSAGKFFDITVANPPYSLDWDNGEYRLADNRFMGYGALAPKGYADLAFLQHIVYHMTDKGHAAVLLPLGVLFRGNAEQTIRQALVSTYNVIDAIIALPNNCFYGTGIPVCCIVLRKDRGQLNNICFIDATNEFIKVGKKNKLTDENIEKIYSAFTDRQDIPHFCSIVDREIIKNNDYNLNVPLYVEAEKVIEEHDIDKLFDEIGQLEVKTEALKKSINAQLEQFGITKKFNVNESLASQYVAPVEEPKAENVNSDAIDYDF